MEETTQTMPEGTVVLLELSNIRMDISSRIYGCQAMHAKKPAKIGLAATRKADIQLFRIRKIKRWRSQAKSTSMKWISDAYANPTATGRQAY